MYLVDEQKHGVGFLLRASTKLLRTSSAVSGNARPFRSFTGLTGNQIRTALAIEAYRFVSCPAAQRASLTPRVDIGLSPSAVHLLTNARFRLCNAPRRLIDSIGLVTVLSPRLDYETATKMG